MNPIEGNNVRCILMPSGNKSAHSIQITETTYKWPGGQQSLVWFVFVSLQLNLLFLKPFSLTCQINFPSLLCFSQCLICLSHPVVRFCSPLLWLSLCICPRLHLSYASFCSVFRVLAATLYMFLQVIFFLF